MMTSPLLSVKGLSKTFGGLSVINDLSFDVPPAGRTAIIGPNGAGKTMLFNLLTGLYPPTAGAIYLHGLDITAMPSRMRIRHGLARTFQNVRLMSGLSVLENMLIGQHHRACTLRELLQLVRVSKRSRWAKEVLEQLEIAGLGSYGEAIVDGLPYGIRKQIDIVRGVLARPRLLLLDEPAAGLNAIERKALKRQLRVISNSGVGLVVVEHDMDFIDDFCTSVIALNFGNKIAEGSLDEVRMTPEVQTAYLGLKDHGH